MAQLRDVIAYILKTYPEKLSDELSNARLTKMVYLADWRNCLRGKGQISNIRWYFDNFGPFVWDVKSEAESYPDLFSLKHSKNMYGSTKTLFRLVDSSYVPNLTASEKRSIDHIVGISSKKYWDDFIKLVYSTHPISSSERYCFLDLEAKAKEYRQLRDG